MAKLSMYGQHTSARLLNPTVPAVVAYDINYQAVLNQADVLGYLKPSLNLRLAQSDFYTNLKVAGLYNLIDNFWLLNSDGSSDFNTLNGKNPTGPRLLKSATGLTFTSKLGFMGDGLSGYLDTQLNLSGQTNYTQNNGSRFSWLYNTNGVTSLANGVIDGEGVGTNNSTFALSTINHRINTTNNLDTAVDMSGIGFKAIVKNSSTTSVLYNGTSSFSRTVLGSAAPSSISINLLRRNTTSFGVSGVSLYGWGAYLNPTQISTLYNIINTYLTAVAAS